MNTKGTCSILFLCASVVLLHGQERHSYRGTYTVSVERPHRIDRDASEETIWTYRISDKKNVVVTEVRRSMPFDVAAPDAMVFENGRLLLVHSFDAYAEIYEQSGDLLRRIPLVPQPSPDYERTIRGAMHASQAILGITMGGEFIQVLSIDVGGRMTMQKEIPGMNITGIAVGQEPDLIAVGTMAWKEGRPVFETDIMMGEDSWRIGAGFSKGLFSDDGRFFGIGNTSIFSVRVGSEQPEWIENVPQEKMLIEAILANGQVTVLSANKPKWFEGGWVYTGPELKTLDANGKTVSTQVVQKPFFSKASLAAREGKVSVILDGQTQE